MKFIASAFVVFIAFSMGHTAKAQSNPTCETIKNRINSRAPITANPSTDLEYASCLLGGSRDVLVLHYVFGEINHQAADNRAGQRLGKNIEKSFCVTTSNNYKLLKAMDVRIEIEDLTGGKMGHHQFSITDC